MGTVGTGNGQVGSGQRHRRFALSLVAVLVFSACLLVSLGKLLHESSESRVEIRELLYWSAAQVSFEYWRFIDTLDRYALGDRSVTMNDVELRLDILWSRLEIYRGGAVGKHLSGVEGAEDVADGLAETLAAIDPRLGSLAPGDAEAYREIRDDIERHALPLYQLAQHTNQYEQRRANDFRERTANTYWLLIAFLLGTLASGAVLVVLLVREARTANDLLAAADHVGRRARKTAGHLKAVLDNAVTGIVTIGSDGIITSFNPAAEAMFALPASEAIGRNVSILMPWSYGRTHGSHVDSYLNGAPARVIGRVREVLGRRSTGETFPVEISVGEVTSDGERSFVGFVTDISRRREAEDQLRHAQKLEALGELTGGIAHEFSNVLAVVGGFAQLAARKVDDPERVQRSLDRIVKAVEQADGLTSQMLAFARKQAVEPRLVEVGGVLRDAEAMILPLTGNGITLQMEVEDRAMPAFADPDLLSQAVLNLAINACHAMPEGGYLVVGCHVVEPGAALRARFPRAKPGPHVAVRVTDSGTGIPDDVLQHIFDPFFTTKEVGKGSGLGLSMVYGTAEQLDGFVDVETELGRGTTFTIHLPLADAVSDGRAGDAVAPMSRGTVLIADDEPAVRALASLAFEERGYTVLVAANGDEAAALERGYAGAIHLLLVDIAMRGQEDPELARELSVARPGLKVILTSRYTPATDDERARLDSGHAFLGKPFDPDELTRLADELIGEHSPAYPRSKGSAPAADTA